MDTGTYISAALHIALIGWAIFGGTFDSDPLPFEVQEVSVISSAEFEALQAAQLAPETSPEPAALVPPDASQDEPELETTTDPETQRTTPETAEAGEPDQTPIETPDPLPPAEVVDTPPEISLPGADVAIALPPRETPQQRQSDRVAPEAIAPPDPETAPDEIEREAVAPEDGETETPQDPQEATAPEEAATEIVTEADEPAGAPLRSIRPSARPQRPVQTAVPADETPDNSAVDDAVAAALAGAATATVPRTPSGPPLSAGEKDALRVAVSNCWNVGSLSTEALQTTVVVAVDMQENARPVNGSIRMLSYSGGSEGAARQAFEAARRAIIRCGARGFGLPVEKFDHWREIEMTFNPENMRIR